MNRVEPIDPRVRLAITQWPPDARRGSVSTFCAEHSISRKTFYEIRKRAAEDGQAAALEARSRRPKSSPTRLTDDAMTQAIGVRAALESSGLDHGPISVHEKMRLFGMDAPSVASLARIFRDAGMARAELRKKPRTAYRRFVYPCQRATMPIISAHRSYSRYKAAGVVNWTAASHRVTPSVQAREWAARKRTPWGHRHLGRIQVGVQSR